MTAPSQEYPSWLTPFPSVFTDVNGIVTTSTTILFLPLTYYGPSIPLNDDWTYGGLTPPASTLGPTLTTTSPAIPPTLTPTSPAIPPTSTSPSSATPIPTTSAPSVSLSSFTPSSPISTFFTPTPTPSTSPAPPGTTPTNGGSQLSKGQRIGVIVASILGLLFLLVLSLSLFLWCKGRRNRRSQTRFSMVTPIDDDYFVVPPEGRTPGEGSPRHSGEEADPFLQQSAGAEPSNQQAEVSPSVPAVARVPPPAAGSLSSSNSSSTNSGYGVVLDRPTLRILSDEERRGERAEELRRIEEESLSPHDDEQKQDYSPLIPPPRLLDPEFAGPSNKSRASYNSHRSSYPLDMDENATLLTARRVRVEDLAPRSSPQSPLDFLPNLAGPSRDSGGWRTSIMNRFSWFKSSESSSRKNSRPTSLITTPLSDYDVEAGKGLLSPLIPDMSEKSDSRSSRGYVLAMEPDDVRPLSSASRHSATSGGTVFYDAQSTIPTIPTIPGSPLTPLPRALTPASHHSENSWSATNNGTTTNNTSLNMATVDSNVTGEPPAYYDTRPHVYSTPLLSPTLSLNPSLPPGFDILDIPAPPPISPFTSSSSLRDTATMNSMAFRVHPFPPGLPTAKSWSDRGDGGFGGRSIGTMPSANSFAVESSLGTEDNSAGISIDVLEEEPPSAGAGWRSLAAVRVDEARRATFGTPQYIHQNDLFSEQGSLHSMRSHLAPGSTRSAGSMPTSRRDNSASVNSGSSGGRSGGSVLSALSLAHSGSISSDDRQQRNGGPISPALSAFGPSRGASPMPPPPLGSLPLAHFGGQQRSGTMRSAMSGTSAAEMGIGPAIPTSPLATFSSAPWAGGLEHDWTPT